MERYITKQIDKQGKDQKRNIIRLGAGEIEKKVQRVKILEGGYWIYWSGIDMNYKGIEGVWIQIKRKKITNVDLVTEAKIHDENVWTVIVVIHQVIIQGRK